MFSFSLIYPGAYLVLFWAAFQRRNPPAWIIPLHLLAMFCMFYNLYFVAKNLRLAEIQKPLGFYEYSGQFFLLWFFPFGIWIIQPRINQLYALHGEADA